MILDKALDKHVNPRTIWAVAYEFEVKADEIALCILKVFKNLLYQRLMVDINRDIKDSAKAFVELKEMVFTDLMTQCFIIANINKSHVVKLKNLLFLLAFKFRNNRIGKVIAKLTK